MALMAYFEVVLHVVITLLLAIHNIVWEMLHLNGHVT